MILWRACLRIVRWLCGLWSGHDPGVYRVDFPWKRGVWCEVCKRCGQVIRIL